MPGAKGRSGGPRPNTGGARPGAGRKPKSYYEALALLPPAPPPDPKPIAVKPKPVLKPKPPAPKKPAPKPKAKPKPRKKPVKKVEVDPALRFPAPERPHVGEVLEAQPHGGALRRAAVAPIDLSELVEGDCDMLEVLTQIALGKVYASPTQVKAAIAVLPYTHAKPGGEEKKGKKEQREDKAKEIASSPRFAPMVAPPQAAKVQ